jgi:hypothetical protein
MSLEDVVAQTAAAVAAATANPHPAAVQAAPVVAPTVAAVATVPAVAVTPVVTPATVTLTPEQWAAYTAAQSRLAELEATERQRATAAAEAEVAALQARGQITQAMNLRETQYQAALAEERKKVSDTESRMRRYALDGELARALASHTLVPNGAEQITQLIRDEFTVEGRGDSIVVQSKTFRSVGDYINEALASRFPHFVLAKNPLGGTATAGTTQRRRRSRRQPQGRPRR